MAPKREWIYLQIHDQVYIVFPQITSHHEQIQESVHQTNTVILKHNIFQHVYEYVTTIFNI